MPPDGLPPPPSARRSWAERDRLWSQTLHRAAAMPFVMSALIGVSRLSDGILWYATILVLPWVAGASGTACALRMTALGAVDLVIYKILKQHFARPRPYVACPDIRACTRSLDEHSFPSGHTLHAVAFSCMLCAYWPAIGWIVWPFTAVVALARVVLGLHYPSDVVAGAAIGAFMAESLLVLF